MFRSRLRETSQKREKRIDSPLVRYNEEDQPVCRVCNVTLKSESLWPAHQASRKHHDAIENIKAAAARQTTTGNSQFGKQSIPQEPHVTTHLPDNFFDSPDAKKHKTELEKNSTGPGPSYPSSSKEVEQIKMMGKFTQSSQQIVRNDAMQAKTILSESISDKGTDEDQSTQKSLISKDKRALEVKQAKGFLPDDGSFYQIDSNDDNQDKKLNQKSENADMVQLKQVKGALPAGFFDNKDADLRARGIEPVKVDIDVAYKEFEKEIQEDLLEVDDRLEEEEIDAAEVREEIEYYEQKAYRERVEMMKQQLKQAKEDRLSKRQESPKFKGMDMSDDSSDDSDVNEDFSVDWRAKRL